MLQIHNLHAEVAGKPILKGLFLENLLDRRAPHPNPFSDVEGPLEFEAEKLLGIALEGSVG